MSSFIKTNSCQKVETKCVSGTLYAPKGDKDVLISKLNSRIAQLEQGEKDFDLLNQELKQLENDISLLNEAKLRLEYEIKQRDEAYTKRIQDLKSDKQNLQNALNDKNCVNKKLIDEKNCLENQLKNKNDEIDDLNNKINDLNSKLDENENNKDGLGNLLKSLNEQEHKLYLANQEKNRLGKKLGDDKAMIKNLDSKIRIHENNLINLQKQMDQSNELNLKFQNDLQNLDNRIAEEKVNNDNLRAGLIQERSYNDCEEQKFSELSCISCNLENKIKCLNSDYERLKISHQKMIEINGIYNNERNKLEEHIMNLNNQNQNLSTEIENVIKDDEHIKNVLTRCERMSFTLSENDSILNQLPNDILCGKLCIPENKVCLSPYHDSRICYSQNKNIMGERKNSGMNIYEMK